MNQKLLLLSGAAVTLVSLIVAANLPVNVPVWFDALSGIGVVAGLLLLSNYEYAAPRQEVRRAVQTRMRRASVAAVKTETRTREPIVELAELAR